MIKIKENLYKLQIHYLGNPVFCDEHASCVEVLKNLSNSTLWPVSNIPSYQKFFKKSDCHSDWSSFGTKPSSICIEKITFHRDIPSSCSLTLMLRRIKTVVQFLLCWIYRHDNLHKRLEHTLVSRIMPFCGSNLTWVKESSAQHFLTRYRLIFECPRA